jgi:acyl-CoA thioesterase
VADHVFAPDGPGRFVPTQLGRGPWDPRAMHGGAPAGLIAGAFDALEADSGLPIARLAFDFVRPVPIAPLDLSTRVIRAGRRVIELAAELRAGETVVCSARALRVAAATPLSAHERVTADEPPLPGPEHGEPHAFTLDGSQAAGFATSMDMRWLEGELGPGPAALWMRLTPPLVAGAVTPPLARLVATADFGNGVAAPVAWGGFLFVNADLTIYLHRPPRGEWIGMRSRTHVDPGGAALTESRLYDESGPVGRSLQSLVLERRQD